MRELSNYEEYQLNRYGNILQTPEVNPDGELESGSEELRRLGEWIELQSEVDRHETESQFYSY